MDCIKHLLNPLQFNYKYARDLVSDLDDDQMTFSPSPGLENHPSFTIGHLITAYGITIKYLGGNYTIPKGWDELFRRNGPGDPRLPTKKIDVYPEKEELLNEFKNQHEILVNALQEVGQEQLKNNFSWRYSNYFPVVIDLLYFMCMTHYSMHLGQLAAWRRALALPSSLARM